MDAVRSPYGPCEVDCTGDPACWPWARSTAADAPETLTSAAARLGARINSLREAARACGHHPRTGRGRPPKGDIVGLPSAVWNEIAASMRAGYRRPGPKPGRRA